MHSDADIMRQVQSGRTELFEQIVDRYRGRLLRFARSKLGDAGPAEDVVQETLLAAYAARHTYDPRFAVSTWLWTILLNLCRREWRRARTRAAQNVAAVEPATSETGLTLLLAGEQRELLGRLLDELPEAEADALRLRFFGGLKFEEIADAMQSSLSGAKVRVRKGLERLSRRLRDEERRADLQVRLRETAESTGAIEPDAAPRPGRKTP
jgi:RNA polymerase sigma-70 factor (ECF subfamily)